MSTSALVRALVDDAAVFPPGELPLRQAVDEHRRHRSSPYADAVGPLLVRATDATSLHRLLAVEDKMPVSLVVRPGGDPQGLPTAVLQLQREDRGQVAGLELPVSDPISLRPVLDLGAPVWLEVWRDTIDEDLDAVAAIGAGAKLRTGGLDPQDVPTDDVLARFVTGCRDRSLRFKLTAGLHHAVRRPAADGADQPEWHGVANVMSATAAAVGGDVDAARGWLAQADRARLRKHLESLDDAQVAAMRASFVSFGCCGVTDPLRELEQLLPGTVSGLPATDPIDLTSTTSTAKERS